MAPASIDAVRATEQRLGLQLLSDYKDFLSISNGLMLPSFEGHAISLLPIEEVVLFEEADKESFDLWCDGSTSPRFAPLALMPREVTSFVESVPDQFVLRKAIALSEVVNTGGIFLCPYPEFGVHVFEVWLLGPWSGCIRYRSFWHFLKTHIEEFLSFEEP